MRKNALIIVAALILALFTACSEGGESDTDKMSSSVVSSENIDSSSTADSSEDSSEAETSMTDDSSNADSSEPETTKPNDSSSEADKTSTTTKKTSDSSQGETSKATTTTKKAETTTQYVYIPPTTSKTTTASTTKTTTKATTKATSQAANYVGKCKFCGKNVTVNDSINLDSYRMCFSCRDAKKCCICGKVCNSSTGTQGYKNLWFCYSCRPDLKPQPQEPEITGTDADARREAQSVVTLTNKLRASKGLSQLKTDSRLTNAAMARAKELAVKFSHGRPWRDDTFIEYEYGFTDIGGAGENIQMSYGTGYHDAQYIYNSFESSSGHKATMLSKGYNYIGVGVYYVYKDGYKYTYVAQLFTTKAI